MGTIIPVWTTPKTVDVHPDRLPEARSSWRPGWYRGTMQGEDLGGRDGQQGVGRGVSTLRYCVSLGDPQPRTTLITGARGPPLRAPRISARS
ncbi:hypothetical protein Nepgr_007261 [Nepenthes gracilis]|uniref:Uncharacterized protein n=1 Tax=Nepenthes gracilis TaxID=150966 RepID=A0AAD3S7C3_NEPGR|nr:hypothetical protein Nepgr_007261 [Nepenthes gracilis]